MENKINSLENEIGEEDSSFLNFNLSKFFFHLLSWWPILLIGLCIGFISAFLINRYKTEVFKTELVFNIESKQENSVLSGINEMNGMVIGQDNYSFEKEVYLLESQSLQNQVVKKLSLNEEYFRVGKIINTQISPQHSPVRINAIDEIKEPKKFKLNQINNSFIQLSLGDKTKKIKMENR